MNDESLTPAPESLRPSALDDFSGQPEVVTQLRVILNGAKARGELVCPHLLFAGPPGLGKTTLSKIVAHELGLPLVSTSGPSIDKPGTLAALLVSLDAPCVVFIDEIHAMSTTAVEMLYSAMEDGKIDIVTPGDAMTSTAWTMELEPFVLVGATTQVGRLPQPFQNRFGHIGRLRPYDTETLTGIVARSARVLGMTLDNDGAALIAARARGTPRIANQWLGRVRDYADANAIVHIDAQVAEQGQALFGVDGAGLGALDRTILATLLDSFAGGPVGLGTLAAAVGEDATTLELSHEPYLMRSGLLRRTARGRAATAATFTALGRAVPQAYQLDATLELEPSA